MKTSVIISVSIISFTVSALAQSQPTAQFTISTVAGNGTTGYSGDGGQAINASLNTPAAVAVDGAGIIYIIDVLNNRIRKVTSDGTITTVAGTGVAGFGGDGGAATRALLNQPGRGAFDPMGNLYFADQNRVRKIAPDGTISTVAGNGSTGYSGDGGPAISASLSLVSDVVSDAAGNLFIADQNNNVVRKVDPRGIISTIAGNGTKGFSGDGGPATAASLNGPVSSVVSVGGDLFICDQQNNRIRKVSNGIITTVAGTGSSGFSGNGGPATSAQLSDPAGIRFDDVGNLYIAERVGNRIRVLRPNGTIETVAGNGTSGYGGDGGIATTASLSIPRGVATYAGLVYIADSNNQRIRLLTPVPQAPAITQGGVVSASAFGGFTSVAPGSWIEIYGSNLASDTRSWATSDFSGVNAPTSLDGTSVTIGGQSAFVDFISPGQVNALMPSNVATGSQPVIVKTTAGASTGFNITVNPVQPGLLAPPSFTINGTHYAVALFADGTYVLPAGAISGIASRPAKAGDTITLYGVGFGPVIPNIPAGKLVGQSNTLADGFQMFLGGLAATASYAGLAPNYTGLYQFNIVIPNAAAGNAVPLTFTLGGMPGSQTLYIAIQN